MHGSSAPYDEMMVVVPGIVRKGEHMHKELLRRRRGCWLLCCWC